jgi:hypothetical protein
VQNLATLSVALKFSEWEEVTDELEKYLWLESACDAGGRLLWTEAWTDRLLREDNSLQFQPS